MKLRPHDDAFPTAAGESRGMTFRQYAAVQIAAGLLSNAKVLTALDGKPVMKHAVDLADSLIAALNAREEMPGTVSNARTEMPT